MSDFEKLAGLVLNLCLEHDIQVCKLPAEANGNAQCLKQTNRFTGLVVARAIIIPKIASETAFAKAMHELGHHLGPDQGPENTLVVQEAGAWKWAVENSPVWGEVSRELCRYSLGTYIRDIPNNPVLPPELRYASAGFGKEPEPGHYIWRLYATGAL